MFGRGKGKKGPAANQLSVEAEPNTLSWAATDAEAREEEPEYDELAEDEELEEEDLEDEADETDDRTPAQRRADLQAELDRQAEEFGLTRVDSTIAYGPNGEDVAAVLDTLAEIDFDEGEQLADAWLATNQAEREIVERELRRSHRDGKHRYELSAAEDAVGTWLNRQLAENEADADLWRVVAEAARGAVDALILGDELDDADFDTLYGPWAAVMDSREESIEGDGSSDAGQNAGESQGEFGPNTELVEELLGRLADLSLNQTRGLIAEWKVQPKEDLRQAHEAMQALAAEDPSWRTQIRAAQDRVARWPNDLPAGTNPASRLASTITETRSAALPPAVDAVSALVLADLLEPADAETLYAAWEAAVGEPKLPAFEDDGVEPEPEPKPKSGGKR